LKPEAASAKAIALHTSNRLDKAYRPGDFSNSADIPWNTAFRGKFADAIEDHRANILGSD